MDDKPYLGIGWSFPVSFDKKEGVSMSYGDGDISEVLLPVEKPSPYIGKVEGFGDLGRMKPVTACADERKNGFGLVDHGISGENVCKEAQRCLQCNPPRPL